MTPGPTTLSGLKQFLIEERYQPYFYHIAQLGLAAVILTALSRLDLAWCQLPGTRVVDMAMLDAQCWRKENVACGRVVYSLDYAQNVKEQK